MSAGTDVVLGVAGGGPVATCDGGGRIRTTAPHGTPLVADVWFGGATGWVRPASDATLRHRTIEGTPVVETVVRVEGADVIRRTYATVGPGGPLVATEITVEGRLPVAVAFLWRRSDGRPLRVHVDGATVSVDDVPVVVGPRAPGAVRAADGADDVAARLGTEGFDDAGPLVAVVWPLAHGSTTRFALAPLPPGEIVPAGLAAADQVVRGWIRQLDGGTRVDVADPVALARLRADVAAALVLAPNSADAAVAAVLDDWGHHADAAGVLARMTEAPDVDADHVALLGALDHHRRRTADPAFARAAVPTVLVAVDALRARTDPAARAAVEAGARLLEAAGEHAAAAVARRPRRRLLARRTSAAASAAATPPSADGLRAFLLGEDDGADVLDLLAGWTPDLAGRPIEVVGLPSRFGPVSFALRWHGPNVALLWEVEGDDGTPSPTLTCAAIDSGWSTTDRRGEALLVPRAPLVVDDGSASFS